MPSPQTGAVAPGPAACARCRACRAPVSSRSLSLTQSLTHNRSLTLAPSRSLSLPLAPSRSLRRHASQRCRLL
eukprot:1888154-Prymnesium_polylepis.1